VVSCHIHLTHRLTASLVVLSTTSTADLITIFEVAAFLRDFSFQVHPRSLVVREEALYELLGLPCWIIICIDKFSTKYTFFNIYHLFSQGSLMGVVLVHTVPLPSRNSKDCNWSRQDLALPAVPVFFKVKLTNECCTIFSSRSMHLKTLSVQLNLFNQSLYQYDCYLVTTSGLRLSSIYDNIPCTTVQSLNGVWPSLKKLSQ